MSETEDRSAPPVESSADNLDAASVAAYLRANPDFFATHADLLTELILPHESGDAVSLVERQVSVLRDRNMDSRKRLGELRETAQTNEALFGKTRDVILAMLDAPDLITLMTALDTQARSVFGIDAVGVFAFDGTLQPVLGIHSCTRADAEEKLGDLLQDVATCGAIGTQQAAFLFPRTTTALQSAAVVPLHHLAFRGLLALGSTDPAKYDSHKGTLFVRYIGEVLSRLLVRNGR